MRQLSHVWRAVSGVYVHRVLAIIGREEGAAQNRAKAGIRLAAILKCSDFPEIL